MNRMQREAQDLRVLERSNREQVFLRKDGWGRGYHEGKAAAYNLAAAWLEIAAVSEPDYEEEEQRDTELEPEEATAEVGGGEQ